MAHMEGANAVLAQHHQKLKGDQMSKMLLRHLKLANVGNLPFLWILD